MIRAFFVKQHFPVCQIPDDLLLDIYAKNLRFSTGIFPDDLFLSIIPKNFHFQAEFLTLF